PVDVKNASACLNLGFPILATPLATCVVTGDDVIINGHGQAVTLPEVSVSGHANVILVAGSPAAQYNFNSITIASQSNISIQTTSPNDKVVVDVIGKNSTGADVATPIDFQGGSFAGVNSCTGCAALCPTCSAFDATQLTFLYSGTAELKYAGNSGAAATLYAPNAQVNLVG